MTTPSSHHFIIIPTISKVEDATTHYDYSYRVAAVATTTAKTSMPQSIARNTK